eukprot:PhM_4_TR7427/c0_g1_i1/m.41586
MTTSLTVYSVCLTSVTIMLLLWFALYLLASWKLIRAVYGRVARLTLILSVLASTCANLIFYSTIHVQSPSPYGAFFSALITFVPYYVVYVWCDVMTAPPQQRLLHIPPLAVLLFTVALYVAVFTTSWTAHNSAFTWVAPITSTLSHLTLLVLCNIRIRRMLPSLVQLRRVRLVLRTVLITYVFKLAALVIGLAGGFVSVPFVFPVEVSPQTLMFGTLFEVMPTLSLAIGFHPRRRQFMIMNTADHSERDNLWIVLDFLTTLLLYRE